MVCRCACYLTSTRKLRDIGALAGEQVQFHRIALFSAPNPSFFDAVLATALSENGAGPSGHPWRCCERRRNRLRVSSLDTVTYSALAGSCGRKIHHRLTIRRHGKRWNPWIATLPGHPAVTPPNRGCLPAEIDSPPVAVMPECRSLERFSASGATQEAAETPFKSPSVAHDIDGRCSSVPSPNVLKPADRVSAVWRRHRRCR